MENKRTKMPQMNIRGRALKEDKELKSIEKSKRFIEGQLSRFDRIEGKIKEGEINKEWTTEWWYCNSIKGYPEPPFNDGKKDYKKTPEKKFEERVREGFKEKKFDGEYALKRIRKARKNYKEDLKEIKEKIERIKNKEF